MTRKYLSGSQDKSCLASLNALQKKEIMVIVTGGAEEHLFYACDTS